MKKFWEKCLGTVNSFSKFETILSEISGAIYDERKSMTFFINLTIFFSETKRQKNLKKFWEKGLGTINSFFKFQKNRSEMSGAIYDERKSITFSIKLTIFVLRN